MRWCDKVLGEGHSALAVPGFRVSPVGLLALVQRVGEGVFSTGIWHSLWHLHHGTGWGGESPKHLNSALLSPTMEAL